jgi:uncharacterized membrane protein/endonuclease YncB( thermonuclease family)
MLNNTDIYSGAIPPPYYEVVATVDQVWDGDTIDVWIENIVVELDPAGEVGEYCWPYDGHCGDGWEIVRFGGGIDAPESYEPGYDDATEFVENLIPVGTTVYLDLDNLAEDPDGRPYRGNYNRLIAVVYAEIDGQWVNINAELLRWGMEAYPNNDWDEYTYIPSEFSVYDWPPYDNDYPYVLDLGERRDVMVSILPSENTGAPGEKVTFTVSIKNTGDVEDTYDLIAGDETGWNLMLADDLIEHVAPGHVRETTLTVTIPEDAENSTEDTVTVTATSQENTEVSDSATCTAIAIEEVVPGVSVSISPSDNEGRPGRTLSYTVRITNEGNVTDAFTLENSDTQDWTLSIPSSTGSLMPSEYEDVTLQVTVPSDAENGDSTVVTVTATSQADDTVVSSDSCAANALVLIPGVSVSISPPEDNGAPGDTVAFTVAVVNTGEVADNFDLTATDDAGWGTTLDDNLLEDLGPGESRQTTVSVTVPSDASENESTRITVTATSRANPMVSAEDSAICTAGSVEEEEEEPSEFPWVPVVGTVVVVVAVISVILVIRPF